jgi:hypothetical protein
MGITATPTVDPWSKVNAVLVTGNSGTMFFTVSNWDPSSSIAPGGNVQLYIRKWTSPTLNAPIAAQSLLHTGWDGLREIQLDTSIGGGQFAYGNPGAQWPIQSGVKNPSEHPKFGFANPLNGTVPQQWSIIPQTGGVGGAQPLSPGMTFTVAPSPTVPDGLVLTMNGVKNGNGGTGNVIVTLQADTVNR